MSKQIRDLVPGDTVHMFGGHRGPEHGAEMEVRRVGRAYLYVSTPKSGELAAEYKFHRDTGVEAVDSNYKRRLVIDTESFLERRRTGALHLKLRRNLNFEPAPGVTAADVEAAAALLRIDLSVVK